MACNDTYIGPTIHEWQSLVQLAAKLGAQPAHVINAIDRGQRCMGHYLTRRDVTPADNLEALGLDARTKTLYRATRYAEHLEHLEQIEVRITLKLRELRRIDITRIDDSQLDRVNALRLELCNSLGLVRRTRTRLTHAERDAEAGQQVLL